jgi:hypothetical protein
MEWTATVEQGLSAAEHGQSAANYGSSKVVHAYLAANWMEWTAMEQEFSLSKALQVAESTAVEVAWTVLSATADLAAQSAVKIVAVVAKAVVAAAKPQTIPMATAKWSSAIPHSKWKTTVDLTAATAAAGEVQVTERVAAATP